MGHREGANQQMLVIDGRLPVIPDDTRRARVARIGAGRRELLLIAVCELPKHPLVVSAAFAQGLEERWHRRPRWRRMHTVVSIMLTQCLGVADDLRIDLLKASF